MSPASRNRGWSDALKTRTRDVIEGAGVFAVRHGRLHLKHVTSGFGTISDEDLHRGVLKVVERSTGIEATFADADELIAVGWAID